MADIINSSESNQSGVIANSFEFAEFEKLAGKGYYAYVRPYFNPEGEARGGYKCIKFTTPDLLTTRVVYLAKNLQIDSSNFDEKKTDLNILVIKDEERENPIFICCLNQAARKEALQDMSDGEEDDPSL